MGGWRVNVRVGEGVGVQVCGDVGLPSTSLMEVKGYSLTRQDTENEKQEWMRGHGNAFPGRFSSLHPLALRWATIRQPVASKIQNARDPERRGPGVPGPCCAGAPLPLKISHDNDEARWLRDREALEASLVRLRLKSGSASPRPAPAPPLPSEKNLLLERIRPYQARPDPLPPSVSGRTSPRSPYGLPLSLLATFFAVAVVSESRISHRPPRAACIVWDGVGGGGRCAGVGGVVIRGSTAAIPPGFGAGKVRVSPVPWSLRDNVVEWYPSFAEAVLKGGLELA